ncbi:hypothetical protein BC831DRAFT_273442 [Entophlyctis helioformis]|nr:hypothetical protein BC831DRAFT_273442 [Entophlyctis helioformis]
MASASGRTLPPKVPGKPRCRLALRVSAIHWHTPTAASSSSTASASASASATSASAARRQRTDQTATASSAPAAAAAGSAVSAGTPSSASVSSVRIMWWGAEAHDTIYPPTFAGAPPAKAGAAPAAYGASNAATAQRTKALNASAAPAQQPTSLAMRDAPDRDVPDLDSLASNTLDPCTLVYDVCCSVKQFKTYLDDMGTLELEVLRDARPVGYVPLRDLSASLHTPGSSVSGSFPILSNRSIRREVHIGSVQLSLSILPLNPSSVSAAGPSSTATSHPRIESLLSAASAKPHTGPSRSMQRALSPSISRFRRQPHDHETFTASQVESLAWIGMPRQCTDKATKLFPITTGTQTPMSTMCTMTRAPTNNLTKDTLIQGDLGIQSRFSMISSQGHYG